MSILFFLNCITVMIKQEQTNTFSTNVKHNLYNPKTKVFMISIEHSVAIVIPNVRNKANKESIISA